MIGVIVTEMLASTSGIGYWISYHRTIFNTAYVYLGILLALTCTLLVHWTLSRAEKRFERWRDLSRSETA